MKIKVCGMKYPENIEAILLSQPDFIGFIFYKNSPRYVADKLNINSIKTIENVKKVGVFVDSPINLVVETAKTYKLDYVQLHGNESIDYIKKLFAENLKIIKAFQITKNFNWSVINQYSEYVSYFLFDTATKNYGGSGLKFDWEQLKQYSGKISFFLSGGIELNDFQEIFQLKLPQLYGIDINSKFESVPGMKNIDLVATMINRVRNESNISSK